MARCLVTGGAGFIGSHLVDGLVWKGHRVRVLDDFSSGKMEHLRHIASKVQIIRGDIGDEKVLKRSLDGVQVVFHHAALRSVPKSMLKPLDTNRVNVEGTLKLLFHSKQSKVKRLVFASSSSIYGDLKKFPQRESQTPSPVSPYAASKLAGEFYCSLFSKAFGLETVSLRYFNVYGPRQDPLSQYAAVIARFILAGLNNRPFEVHGDGKQSRDFVFVTDVVRANRLAAISRKAAGHVINVGAGKVYSVLQIARTVAKVLNKPLNKKHAPPRAGDARKTLADIGKQKRLLKCKPRVELYSGIQQTAEFFKNRVTGQKPG